MIVFALVVMVIATRLIASVSTSTLSEAVWQIYKSLAPGRTLRQYRTKRQQLLAVRAERANTSSQDEFAKWARLDREHQSLKKELDVLNAAVAASRQKVVVGMSIIKWLATTGVKIYVQWRYRAEPVIWLPPGAVPNALEWFLALPSAPKGSISVATWVVVSDVTITQVLTLLRKYPNIKAPAQPHSRSHSQS